MFCSKCGTNAGQGSTQCPQCGEKIGEKIGGNSFTVTVPPMPDSSQVSRFLSFDIMITPAIMKVIYVIVSVVIFFASFAMAIAGFGGFVGFLVGLIMALFSLVFWRVACEQMLLFFTINRTLREIRDDSRRG